MSTRPWFNFFPRHGWCFAIAAKKLIKNKRYQFDIIQNQNKIIPLEEKKDQRMPSEK